MHFPASRDIEVFFFVTDKNKETTLYFAPYTAGKETESSGSNFI